MHSDGGITRITIKLTSSSALVRNISLLFSSSVKLYIFISLRSDGHSYTTPTVDLYSNAQFGDRLERVADHCNQVLPCSTDWALCYKARHIRMKQLNSIFASESQFTATFRSPIAFAINQRLYSYPEVACYVLWMQHLSLLCNKKYNNFRELISF